MKDAKGHGSNKRGGTAKVSVDSAKIGHRMWDTGAGNSEHNVQTGGAWNADHEAAFQLSRGNPKAAAAPVHPGATGVSGGQMDAYLRFARGFKGSGAVREPRRKDVGTRKD